MSSTTSVVRLKDLKSDLICNVPSIICCCWCLISPKPSPLVSSDSLISHGFTAGPDPFPPVIRLDLQKMAKKFGNLRQMYRIVHVITFIKQLTASQLNNTNDVMKKILNYLRVLERYPNLVRSNKMAAEKRRLRTFQRKYIK